MFFFFFVSHAIVRRSLLVGSLLHIRYIYNKELSLTLTVCSPKKTNIHLFYVFSVLFSLFVSSFFRLVFSRFYVERKTIYLFICFNMHLLIVSMYIVHIETKATAWLWMTTCLMLRMSHFIWHLKPNKRIEENRNERKTFVTAILKYVFENLNKRTQQPK